MSAFVYLLWQCSGTESGARYPMPPQQPPIQSLVQPIQYPRERDTDTRCGRGTSYYGKYSMPCQFHFVGWSGRVQCQSWLLRLIMLCYVQCMAVLARIIYRCIYICIIGNGFNLTMSIVQHNYGCQNRGQCYVCMYSPHSSCTDHHRTAAPGASSCSYPAYPSKGILIITLY